MVGLGAEVARVALPANADDQLDRFLDKPGEDRLVQPRRAVDLGRAEGRVDQWSRGGQGIEPAGCRVSRGAVRWRWADEVCCRRRLLVRSHPNGRHGGEREIAVAPFAGWIRGEAKFAAKRIERRRQGGLGTEPERPHSRVGQAEQLGGQARPELQAVAHEQVRLPPLGEGEEVGHGGACGGVTPVRIGPT
jgi:hypothetical protein